MPICYLILCPPKLTLAATPWPSGGGFSTWCYQRGVHFGLSASGPKLIAAARLTAMIPLILSPWLWPPPGWAQTSSGSPASEGSFDELPPSSSTPSAQPVTSKASPAPQPLTVLSASSEALTRSFSDSQKELYYELADQLRCPTCSGLSILQSDAPFSLQIRQTLAEQIQASLSHSEITEFFTQRYGLWILRNPPRHGFHLLAWILPLLLALMGPALLIINKLSSSSPISSPPSADQPSFDLPPPQNQRGLLNNPSKLIREELLEQMQQDLDILRQHHSHHKGSHHPPALRHPPSSSSQGLA